MLAFSRSKIINIYEYYLSSIFHMQDSATTHVPNTNHWCGSALERSPYSRQQYYMRRLQLLFIVQATHTLTTDGKWYVSLQGTTLRITNAIPHPPFSAWMRIPAKLFRN